MLEQVQAGLSILSRHAFVCVVEPGGLTFPLFGWSHCFGYRGALGSVSLPAPRSGQIAVGST